MKQVADWENIKNGIKTVKLQAFISFVLFLLPKPDSNTLMEK